MPQSLKMFERMSIKKIRALANEVFDDLWMSLQQFAPAIRRHGDEYFSRGLVGPLDFAPGRISATVRGSAPYSTAWLLSESGWRSSCTCPIGPHCKHAHALGSKFMVQLDNGDDLPTELLHRVLDGLLEGSANFALDGLPGQRVPAPAPPPPVTFEDLLGARDPRIRNEFCTRMLLEAGIVIAPAGLAAVHGCLNQREPQLMGWLLTQEIARFTGGPVPPALEPFRVRPDLARVAAETRRNEIEQFLIGWAGLRTQQAERSLRVLLDLSPAPRGGCRVRIESRLTSARLKDEPRALEQLRALQSQVRSNPDLLTHEHTELLNAVVATGLDLQSAAYSGYPVRSRRGPIADLLHTILPSPNVCWSHLLPSDLAACGGVTPGERVRFEHDPVRLLPTIDPGEQDDEACLEVVATWPDGRRRPFTQLVVVNGTDQPYAAEPAFVLSEGVLYPLVEYPPAEVLRLMAVTPSVPIHRRDGAGLVRALAAALPEGTLSLTALTAVHPVEPVVLLHLDDDDRLFIRVAAHTPGAQWPADQTSSTTARVFEYSPDGRWHELPGAALARTDTGELTEIERDPPPDPARHAETGPPAPGAGHAWLHAPDPASVAPVVEWLRSLGAQPASAALRGRFRSDHEAPGWMIKLAPRSVPLLAEAWQRRPGGVRWLGNRAMLALLGPGRRLVPSIRARSSGVDLLAVSAEWEAEGLALTDADVARLRASDAPWVKLSGGWVRRDALDIHDQVSDVLADLGVEPGAGEQQLSVWQLAQARPESLAALERMGADPQAIAVVRTLRERVAAFDGLPRCRIPRAFVGELRPYQRQGLDFLAYTASLGMGAILADDMGLGKTVQALAWLLHLREGAPKPGPALVICPASVAHNWEREARQFAPRLRVLQLARGADRLRQMDSLAQYDLVITNYALLRRDAERWRATRLFAAIVDEAQQIKNPRATVSQVASGLSATHRLALTGTPIENRALDLWSIVQFVNPGYLGDQASFVRRFDRADAPPHAGRLLAAKLRPLLLRRLKKEVAPELPERIEERRDCEMAPGQRKLYLAELARARTEMQSLAAAGGVGNHKIEILAMLTRLRQICCHPRLVGGKENLGSGKFEALFELLEPLLAEGHKVLVFSQFVKALGLVQAEMELRRIAHHLLTGSTIDRPGVVRAFEQDTNPCAFLISLRAGGTGLNLTAASYVVLLDPWWNPAVEAQAIDRTHRIGQDRTVIAYRLLMQGTIEEKIWELQQRKGDIARGVLGEDGFARTLDREALDYLFAED